MSAARATTYAIEVADLFVLHPTPAGAVAALRGLRLQVPAGERLVVHGPNGSGKTTLLKVLSGRVRPAAGRVELTGTDPAGPDSRRLRREVLGLVDQHARTTLRPELTVAENVALSLRLSGVRPGPARAQAYDVLGELGLTGLAARATPTLSGGEQQRVAVAAALVHRPPVVLADEPTGALDRASADQVYDLLAQAVDTIEATLVLVSHDPRAARVGDRVVRIRDGRLSEQWSPDAPDDEQAVVDDRGWLRLPPVARRAVGDTARITTGAAAVTLTPGKPVEPQTVNDEEPVEGDGRPHEVVARLDAVTACRGGRTVLDRVGLVARTGEVTVVAGPSGSGKSTLLRILTGLAPADDGSVEVLGTDLRTADRAARAALRRSAMAVTGQEGALVDGLDVGANLALAATVRGENRSAADSYPIAALGLGALLDRPVSTLSGGERQRAGLARALVGRPRLLVLDEPSAELDEAYAVAVADVLRAAARAGAAVVVATHDPALVAVADARLDLV